MDKPSHWVTFLNYIFNPMAGFCTYFTQNWVKTTQHFLECKYQVHLLLIFAHCRCLHVLACECWVYSVCSLGRACGQQACASTLPTVT